MMKKLGALDWIALILVVIGGVNWGLISLFNFNLVNVIFGSIALIEKIVYVLVGISALYVILTASTWGKKEEPAA